MRSMSKTLVVALVFALAPAGVVRAACGVGSNLWEGREGTIPWLAASTTNYWTFKAISTTFGLAGCTEEDNWFANDTNAKVRHYASNNFDQLAEDMARGQGEHLDAFTYLLQVREQDRAHFRAFTQENLPALLPQDNVTVGEMLSNLDSLMAEDERLSGYVRS